jgi:hypothetical protein
MKECRGALGKRLKYMVNFILMLLYPVGRNCSTHRIGGWVSFRTSQGVVGRGKISCCYGDFCWK